MTSRFLLLALSAAFLSAGCKSRLGGHTPRATATMRDASGRYGQLAVSQLRLATDVYGSLVKSCVERLIAWS